LTQLKLSFFVLKTGKFPRRNGVLVVVERQFEGEKICRRQQLQVVVAPGIGQLFQVWLGSKLVKIRHNRD